MHKSFWLSYKYLVLMLASVFIIWSFVYIVGFTYTSVDREAYERGEIKLTLGLDYWWPEKQGGYQPMPFQDRLKFLIEDGKELSPEEVVRYLDPKHKAIVKDGKIYLYESEWYKWEHVYWAPLNFATSKLAMARSYLPQ